MMALLPQRCTRCDPAASPCRSPSFRRVAFRAELPFNTDDSHKFVRIIRDLSFSDDSKDKNS